MVNIKYASVTKMCSLKNEFYKASESDPLSIFFVFSLQKNPKDRPSAPELMVCINLIYMSMPNKIV